MLCFYPILRLFPNKPVIISRRGEDELRVTAFCKLLRQDYHANEHGYQLYCSVEPVAASDGVIGKAIAENDTKRGETEVGGDGTVLLVPLLLRGTPAERTTVPERTGHRAGMVQEGRKPAARGRP